MTFRSLGVFAAGLGVALFGGWFAFPKLLYSSRNQPLNFSHKVHVEKGGAKCEDCHSLAEDGAFAGIPKVATCAGCHAAPLGQSADEKRLIDEYVTPNREIGWLVYARQPDNVHFSHATHLKLARLACERCHGQQGRSDRLRAFEQNRLSGYSRDVWGQSISRLRPGEHPGMKMDDCLECHRQHRVQASCLACHR